MRRTIERKEIKWNAHAVHAYTGALFLGDITTVRVSRVSRASSFIHSSTPPDDDHDDDKTARAQVVALSRPGERGVA